MEMHRKTNTIQRAKEKIIILIRAVKEVRIRLFVNKKQDDSLAKHKSCFCKQIRLNSSTVSHVHRCRHRHARTPTTVNTHTGTRAHTQPHLFCYFPLQHLVLISFLMRLRLRPIRADYQRRSGVGCVAHYDSCPGGQTRMKETSTLCAHVHAQIHAHKPGCDSFPSKNMNPASGGSTPLLPRST